MPTCSLVVALALAAAGPAPERIVLVPATGTNVSDGILAAAQDVLKGHLVRTGRFLVALAPGASSARAEPASAEIGAAVRAAQADRAVALRIVRLGATAKVRLTSYDAQGDLVAIDELGAGSPDDLDPVLARLARGLADGRPAAQLAEIDTVTEREADALLKLSATHVFGLRLSYLVSIVRPASRGSVEIPGFGVFWLYDAREVLAEISADFNGHDDDHAFALGLGAYYPFMRSNVTPYLGGNLRYAWTRLGGSGASGLQAGATAGLLLGRLSTVQFRADLGYFVNLFREQSRAFVFDPITGNVSSGGTAAVSHGPTFSLGIGF